MTKHVPDRVLPEAFEPEPQPQPGPDRTSQRNERIRQLEVAAKARRATLRRLERWLLQIERNEENVLGEDENARRSAMARRRGRRGAVHHPSAIRGARKRTMKKTSEWGRRPESAPAPTPAPEDLALGIAGGGAACQLEGDDV